MGKILWIIVRIILVIIVFSLGIWTGWIVKIYNIISMVNTGFFSQTPAWLNFLIGTVVLAVVIALARGIGD